MFKAPWLHCTGNSKFNKYFLICLKTTSGLQAALTAQVKLGRLDVISMIVGMTLADTPESNVALVHKFTFLTPTNQETEFIKYNLV